MLTAAHTKFSTTEITLLLKLAIPIILSNFVQASVGFFSTFFLAHLGTDELAAGAIASWIFTTLMVILWGTLTSVSVLVSQKHGEKDDNGVSQVLRDGLLLALLFVIPASLLIWNLSPLLLLAGQHPATVMLIQNYMHGLAWGLIPDFISLVLLQFLIGLGHTRTEMICSFLWVPLNIFCNYALVFGKFGLPALGIAGIGWGTTLAYWITTIILIIFMLVNKKYRHYFQTILQLRHTRYLGELWQLGLPMGAMYCIEIGFFLVLTLLMGRFGNQILAANQITLQYLGLLSGASFSIAQAITVRMGHTLGAREKNLAERAVYIGVSFAVSFMLLVAVCYWFFPQKLISLDLDVHHRKNAEIIMYATQFFAISAIFQILEAARITLFGALRGLKDTRFTLLTSILSFWFIALPLGYLLAVSLHLGGNGLWWGLVIGASFSMLLLALRFRDKMKRYQF